MNNLGYEKADPLLMIKIGDWKHLKRDKKICGFITLCRGDRRLGDTLRNRQVNILFYPEPGKRVVSFHDTPVSVITAVLPLKCVKSVGMQVLMQVSAE
ncbi:MAG: hypothetical protein Q8R29_02865 [bacterium]|nr:hypothetical protein [bacterium]